MSKRNELVTTIIDALQEKKGRDIVVADLSQIDDTICRWFVVCTGGSPSQVQTLAQNVGERALHDLAIRPTAVDGMRNAQWVAMDYTDVMVHVFLPETRDFYDIEHLWADAQLDAIPDLD